MENDNYGIISLVCGIISILTAFAGQYALLGIISGIAGVVLAKHSLDNNPGNSIGRAGFITSVIGIVLASLFFIACVACAGVLFGIMRNF
ncbi:MAG: hypothetical protein MSH08_07290 [Ezakiella sp.]|nr:hypothetical protein [Ezakiella sp.]MDD7472144.1 hypothetical protein [Bacillota bacterium]MDY3923489.1 hypothetical protein [Ezakiella sp.]